MPLRHSSPIDMDRRPVKAPGHSIEALFALIFAVCVLAALFLLTS